MIKRLFIYILFDFASRSAFYTCRSKSLLIPKNYYLFSHYRLVDVSMFIYVTYIWLTICSIFSIEYDIVMANHECLSLPYSTYRMPAFIRSKFYRSIAVSLTRVSQTCAFISFVLIAKVNNL